MPAAGEEKNRVFLARFGQFLRLALTVGATPPPKLLAIGIAGTCPRGLVSGERH
jgi:hypothetical protein